MKVKAKGFTLVELLVVIGIIALLISILLPALTTAREQANIVACAAQMRSMGQNIEMYRSQNKSAFPPIATTYDNGSHRTSPNVWTLTKLIPNSRAYSCPSVRSRLTIAPVFNPSRANQEILTSYPYNYLLGGQERGVGLARPRLEGTNYICNPPRSIPAPTETAVFLEQPLLVALETNPPATTSPPNTTDRGILYASLRTVSPSLQNVDGDLVNKHQIFRDTGPVHLVKASTAFAGTVGGYQAKQGYNNVCYADGSVRRAYVRQGQQGTSLTDYKVLNTPDDSTINGVSTLLTNVTLEGTRYDPWTSP